MQSGKLTMLRIVCIIPMSVSLFHWFTSSNNQFELLDKEVINYLPKVPLLLLLG